MLESIGSYIDISNVLFGLNYAISTYDGGYESISSVTQDAWNGFKGTHQPVSDDLTPTQRLIYGAMRVVAIFAALFRTARLPREMFVSQGMRETNPTNAFFKWLLTMLVCALCYDLQATLEGLSEFVATEI